MFNLISLNMKILFLFVVMLAFALGVSADTNTISGTSESAEWLSDIPDYGGEFKLDAEVNDNVNISLRTRQDAIFLYKNALKAVDSQSLSLAKGGIGLTIKSKNLDNCTDAEGMTKDYSQLGYSIAK